MTAMIPDADPASILAVTLTSLPDILAEAVRTGIAAGVREALDGVERLPAKKLFNADEASEITGLPKSYFEDESAAGRMGSRKIGKYRRYSEADIDEFIEAGAVPATSGQVAEFRRKRQKARSTGIAA